MIALLQLNTAANFEAPEKKVTIDAENFFEEALPTQN